MEPITSNYVNSDFDWKKLAMVIGSILVLLFVWSWLSNPMVVTVTGSGQVIVPATNATLSFTLSSNNTTIQDSVSAVTNKANSIRGYLKSKGIAESDIAQSQVMAVPAQLVNPSLTGFQATISMAFKTTKVTDVPNLVSDLYANGALIVAQPVLSVENQDKLSQQAFDSALKDAKSQAATIGFKNWKFIRKIVSISQVTSPSTSTSTTSDISGTNGVFKIVKAVSVSYKMW